MRVDFGRAGKGKSDMIALQCSACVSKRKIAPTAFFGKIAPTRSGVGNFAPRPVSAVKTAKN